MNIFELPGRIGLAPMAGVTDFPFRRICFELGAEFAFTEMISAKSVLINLEINKQYLPRSEEKGKVIIQLFGSDPYEIAEAARMVEDQGLWVDLNAGCPVAKVLKKGAGSGLLRDLEHFRKVVRALRGAVKRCSVKTRLGWDKDEFEKIYSILVEEGVDVIFVHGRTAKQMYSGRAKWRIYNPGIVPLYISGDLYTVEDIKTALEESGAAGAIVARGAIGNPWIFSSDRAPEPMERLVIIKRHLDYLHQEYGDYGAVVFRKFVAGYTKGLPHAREFREKVMKLRTVEEVKNEFEAYFRSFSSQATRFLDTGGMYDENIPG